jgi:transcriptional regulator with PAS, ATPase and Fis domain
MRSLFAWIGLTDIKASDGKTEFGLGPIAQAMAARTFDEVVLFSNLDKRITSKYLKWLASKSSIQVRIVQIQLSGPTNFGEIYSGVTETLETIRNQPDQRFTFHLSPGTPAMAAVWIIVAKTKFPAELIESSKEAGVKTVSVPFDISAEFIPDILSSAGSKLQDLSDELTQDASTFDDIIHQSSEIKRVVSFAQKVAALDQPVLIEGESGTGKELFANAIHRGSLRNDKPFVAVNCGAIPRDLVESELFGHEKGAFTGAVGKHIGKFVQAQGGTIFLDEIGELPLSVQVKLLRVLQEKEITPIGAKASIKLDVRVISATNRTLIDEAAIGSFREDLFYRLAVFVLNIPPLRYRPGDLSLLIKHFLELLNKENTGRFWKVDKRLSPNAKNMLLTHTWPGNVRELQSTLLRAAVFANGPSIEQNDIAQSIFATTKSERKGTVEYRPIHEGFNLQAALGDTARYYLKEAILLSAGNKSQAAKMLGLPSYQTFLNWWQRYVRDRESGGQSGN